MLVSELVEETRNLLLSGQREERNKLAGSMTTSATTPTFTYDLGSIKKGSKVSIALEDMYVWSTSSQTATVDRAQWGSVLSAHSSGDIAYVNPKFSAFDIVSAMVREVRSLTAPVNGLYYMEDYPLSYNPVITGYDFPHDVISIYEVRYNTPSPTNEWYRSQDWELSRNAGSDFASDTAIFIRDAYPTSDVVVKAKVKFSDIPLDLTADTDDLHIPDNILDIISIGAAWRLTAPREVRRNFTETQGDTRRANEVPPGAELGGSRELGAIRLKRIKEEAGRLNQLYPISAPRYPYSIR